MNHSLLQTAKVSPTPPKPSSVRFDRVTGVRLVVFISLLLANIVEVEDEGFGSEVRPNGWVVASVLRPANIEDHVRTGTSLRQCAIQATSTMT